MACDVKVYGAPGSHPPEVISQDENNRFVTDAQIEQWTNGTAGQGQYMAMVFRRSTTVPVTPAGGSFNIPIPDGGLWTNSPLPGIDPVFVSTRFFTSDGKDPQQAVWSPPVLFVKHGTIGSTGPQGEKGDPGIQGVPGNDGINGADGVNGNDGVSIVWLGEASSHPIGAVNGNSYYNTTDKKTYIFQDDAWYQMTVDGVDGTSGLSHAIVTLFKTSPTAAVAPVSFSGTFTYTYATGVLSGGELNGWSQSIPTVNMGEYLWVRQATAVSENDTDPIEATEFSAAVVLSGAGMDGLNTSTATLYNKNTSATVAPTVPTGTFSYSFVTHLLTGGNPNGWTNSAPNVGEGEYLWLIQATASSIIDTDLIEATEFSTPVVIAASGNNGLDIVWKGDLAAPPTNPVKNWVYRDSNNRTVYIYNGTAWEVMVLDGSDGPQGAQGIQGIPGVTTYTWIKYADDAVGSGLSDSPLNKAFIGLAYNKTSATESTTATDYTWSLIKGEKGDTGDIGPVGPAGVTTYTWIKYSDNADGTGLYDVPTATTLYIGIATNKTVAAESTVKTDYIWSKFRGDQGIPGDDAVTYYTWIKYADSAAGEGLSDSPTGKTYIGLAYNKESAVESTTPSDYSWSLIKGDTGTSGQGIVKSFSFIRATAVPGTPSGGTFSSPNPTTAGWSDGIPTGTDPIYVSKRTFTSDGLAPHESVWTTPVILAQNGANASGATVRYKFSTNTTAPATGTGSSAYPGTGWTSTASSSTIWMTHQVNTTDYVGNIITYGAWVTPIKIKGETGTTGAPGLSVFITYHDADPQGIPPTPPTNVEGTNNGWHTDATADVGWMSQKVDDGTGIGWGLAIPIRGSNGASGPRGSNTFTIDENDAGSYYITPAVAESWAGTLTNENAQAVAKDIIGVPSGNGFSPDGYIRPNDKITVSDHTNQIAGTRIYLGISTNNPTTILASHFSGLITEVIDGNLLINGTVSVDALGADVVSAGKIKSNLLLVTNAEISGQIKSDAVGSTDLPMWEINKDGSLILRANNGSTILQSGGTLDKNFIDGLGNLASVNKITPANISTYMDSAAIGSAYIADAAVGTLKIQDNAVTVPVGAYTAGNIALGTSWVTIQQATINALGQPVSIDYAAAYFILWSSTGNVTGELYCRLVYSTGTEIIPEYMVESHFGAPVATLRGTLSFSTMIFPAESVTVYLQLRLNTTSGLTEHKNAFCRYLGLIGMKR